MEKLRKLLFLFLIVFSSICLSGCFFWAINDSFAIGMGKKEIKKANGEVKKIEVDSPLKNIFGWGMK